MSSKGQPERALSVAGVGPVSRETLDRLNGLVALLEKWQAVHNLIAPASNDEIWERHVADSAQLLALAPTARRWLDLGSGGGFPGLVTAALLADEPGARVTLIESNRKKSAFLRSAGRELGLPIAVRSERIEEVVIDWTDPLDAISARALAPLEVLCGYTAPLLARGAVAWLHKGSDFASERDAASLAWTLDLLEHKSRIGSGVIVELRGAARRRAAGRP